MFLYNLWIDAVEVEEGVTGDQLWVGEQGACEGFRGELAVNGGGRVVWGKQ